MGGSADAGIRGGVEVDVTRFSLADGGSEVVGCGTAKTPEPTIEPSRRDCRRRFGSLELQSGNDAAMPLRMAEYCLGIFRLFGRFPRQVVLYVGEPQLRMENELRGVDVLFWYGLIDMSASELEDVSMRVLDAKSVEELLR